MATQIQLKDLGSAVSSLNGEKMTIAVTRHVPLVLHTPKICLWSSHSGKRISGVLRAQEMCLEAANIVLFLLNEI